MNINNYPNYQQPALLPPSLAVPPGEAVMEGPRTSQFDVPELLRRYYPLAILITLVGLAVGFLAVAFFPPVYRAQARLEVRSNSGLMKIQSMEDGSDQIDLETESRILLSNKFLTQVLSRMQLDTPPPPPVHDDIFSRLRRRLKIGAYDEVPVAVMKDGLEGDRVPKPLAMALLSLDAHPIDRTRILEVTCESTNPEIAANFLNSLFDEYIQRNMQVRLESVSLTSTWLQQQVEQTKNKMLEAEARLQGFVRNSGNLFLSDNSDATLANTQLREYQDRLAEAQTDLITKQTRYEMVQKAPPESLADVLNDEEVRSSESKLADLQREKASLTTTLMPANPKVKRVDVQIAELRATINKLILGAKQRITNEYDAARRNRDALNAAYSKQAAKVGGESAKEAEYNALKKEADSARQIYNTMLLQSNQVSVAGSAPVNNIRITDPAVPPRLPFKPKPLVIVGVGGAVGLAFCCGIVLLREGLNQRVTSPYHARRLSNLPQLGVIPSVEGVASRRKWLSRRGATTGDEDASRILAEPKSSADPSAPSQNPLLAESFRVTLASLLRDSGESPRPQIILVTSPGPEEGKTTITSNLGIALAETGRSVLVIDADFRRPRAHKVFGLSNSKGLVDLLDESSPVGQYPREMLGAQTSVPLLRVLANGRRSENISKALYSSRFRQLLQRARKEFDTVLIDAPPMLPVADARVLSAMADGVVLVLRSGVTDKASAVQSLNQLREDGVFVLGTVLNDWKPSKAHIQKNYYYSACDTYDRT